MISERPNDPLISTPLTELLGVAHPVMSAPMGDTAGGRLAAAVSAAGGFGVIGGGYADPAWLEREIGAAAGERVGIGFITFALEERPGSLAIALDAEPVAIQLSFGDPRPFADAIHASGALLICQVQTAAELADATAAGADVIVAQGMDAGGHGRPNRGTMGLVPSVVDSATPVPVVAAGGMADGRGLAAALMLGAAGVVLGTRFLATHEALSSPAESSALLAGRSEDTVRTEAFDRIRGPAWPQGHDGRALRNRLVDMWEATSDDVALRRTYEQSAPDDRSIRPVWAGEGLDLITTIEPAGAVVTDIVHDAARRLAAGSDLLTAARERTELPGSGRNPSR